MSKPFYTSFTVIIISLILFLLANYYEKGSLRPKENIIKHENRQDHPELLEEYHKLIRTRYKEIPGRVYVANYRIDELRKLETNNKGNARLEEINWVERGPGNVAGRTRGLLVLDGDVNKNTWLAGSASGGIWKTADGGLTWANKTSDLPNLSTTVLAKSESNDVVVYAGTGEFFNNVGGVDGNGIFKSIDSGETWSQLEFTASNPDFRNTFAIIVHPQNPNILLAAVSETSSKIFQSDLKSTIFQSVDGGISWQEKYATNRRIQDLIFNPDDFQIQYASVNGTGVLKSIDGGETWELKGREIITNGRIKLAVAPSAPETIYASVQGSISGSYGSTNPTGSNGSDLYVSKDSGENWELLIEENGGINHNFLDGQGGYDNTIVVNPYNENDVYIGGVDLFNMLIKDQGPSIPVVDEVDTINIGFINFINFGATFFGGILETGNHNQAVGLVNEDFVDVEIRFGSGKTQLAHRFSIKKGSGVNGDDGAGVQPNGYKYEDYVSVPFEVWDVTNNRQLMVSFRDQENDGSWDLVERDPNDATIGREYFFVNAVEYKTVPDPNISKDGGHSYKQMYFMWPSLTNGNVFNPNNLPEATISIIKSELETRSRKTIPISDSRAQYNGRNASNQTIGESNQQDMHPDHHNLLVIKEDESAKTYRLLNANDGGVFLSNISTEPGVNDGDWTFLGNGYNTCQFYGVDKKPGKMEFIGGMQDNGSWRSPKNEDALRTSAYVRQATGDGFEAIWHYGDENLLICSSQGNIFRKSINGGKSWTGANLGYTEPSSPFVSKLDYSLNNPDVVFTVGSQGVWKSMDFADSWELTPIDNNWTDFGFVMDVKTSISNHDIVWAGGGMTSESRIHVSTDGGNSFSQVNNFQPEELLGRISGIETHPSKDSTAYVLFSFSNGPKVIKTDDLGQTWEELSGFGTGFESINGFPNVAVYTLLVMPFNNSIIWVGTEIGIVESVDSGLNWHLLNSDLPAVSIWELKIVDDEVIAATHGRGIWTANISDINSVPFIASYKEITGIPPVLKINVRANYDSMLIYSDNKFLLKVESPAVGKQEIELPIEISKRSKFFVTSYIDGTGYKSSSATLDVHVKEGNVLSVNSGLKELKTLSIYPNPVSKGSFFSVKVKESPGFKINIYSQGGSLVSSKMIDNLKTDEEVLINAPKVPGLYIIKLIREDSAVGSARIIVQ